MAVTASYQLNSIYIDTDAVAATTIGGIVRQTINTGVEIVKDNSSGSLYPEAAYVASAAPSASFTTTHCEELFLAAGIRSMCITSSVNSGVHLWARKLLCSGIAGSSSHEQYTFLNGVLVPTSMTCDHQGNASIDAQILGVASGANAALTIASSQTISASTVVNTERWTLYSASIAGTAISGIKGCSVNFGNTPVIESADGDTSPTFAAVQETAPTIQLRGIDPVGWWSASGGLSGVACTHANTVLYLKQRGVVVGTDAHIKLTLNGLAYSQQVFDASGNATGETDFNIEGTEDSSGNAPLIMAIDPIS